ncbi:hypothetical protein ACH427_27895 [Streptomyces sp. NPDC020379]|uniref:hypothetical protein n=1 Tax=Streptomyces sp. NPDC020379 TaxID=3365071 RepID=UPI00379D5CEA
MESGDDTEQLGEDYLGPELCDLCGPRSATTANGRNYFGRINAQAEENPLNCMAVVRTTADARDGFTW